MDNQYPETASFFTTNLERDPEAGINA